MKPVVWAPQAIEDVEAISAYVGRDSARYADLYVERIVEAVERLERFALPGPGWFLNFVTNQSVRSSTAAILWWVSTPDLPPACAGTAMPNEPL